MKLKRHSHFAAEVSTSSLNDIMFFLLLFFLIVSTFANPNVIKLMLPKAKSTQTLSKKQITLSITPDKKYFIDKAEVPFERIEEILLAKKEEISSKGTTEGVQNVMTVILRADASLTIQDLVDILQIGNKLKISMTLATDKSK